MKIGLVRRGYSATGGAEAYLLRFAHAVAARGHLPVLFSSEWSASSWPWERVGMQARDPFAFADEVETRRRACDFLFSLERIWSCDAYRAGDGVHARWLQLRAEAEPFWRPWFRGLQRKHRQILALEKRLIGEGGARLVIANSRMVKGDAEALFPNPSARIHVVYNGVAAIHPPAGTREATRARLGIDDDAYVLLFAGSGWERKGLRYAISSVDSLAPGTLLLVAGDGAKRGLPVSRRVHYLGPVADLAPYFAAADAFVLPTLYEPFSNACLEALSAGLPVLTTRYNGFAEIMDAGIHGEVVAEPSDIDAWRAAIEAWRPRERRLSARPHLQARAAPYSIDENVRQTLGLIAPP